MVEVKLDEQQLESLLFQSDNFVLDKKRQNRIEALRAASRIVAGIFAANMQPRRDDGTKADGIEATLEFAKQFARWLETGERNEQT